MLDSANRNIIHRDGPKTKENTQVIQPDETGGCDVSAQDSRASNVAPALSCSRAATEALAGCTL